MADLATQYLQQQQKLANAGARASTQTVKAPKPLTPKQQEQLAAQQTQEAIDTAAAQIANNLDNEPWFANGSQQLRQDAVDQFKVTDLEQVIASDPRLSTDTYLANQYKAAVNRELKRVIDRRKAQDEAETGGKPGDWGTTLAGAGRNIIEAMMQMSASLDALKIRGGANVPYRYNAEERARLDALNYADNQAKAVDLDKLEQMLADGTAPDPDLIRANLEGARQTLAASAAERKAITEQATARTRKENADLMQSFLQKLQEINDYHKDGISRNAALREHARRQAELQAHDPDGYLIGLLGNDHKIASTLLTAATQAPQMILSAGAAMLGSAAGPAGTVAALAAAGGLMGASGQAQSIIQDVESASEQELNAIPAYAEMIKEGKSSEQARALLAMAMLSSAEGVKAGIASALMNAVGGQLNPGALLVKAGVAKKLLSLPLFKNRLAKAAGAVATGAAEETGTEALDQVLTNYTKRSLKPEQALTEDVGLSAAQGAYIGGVLSSPGAARQIISPTPAATPAATTPPPAGAPTGGAGAAAGATGPTPAGATAGGAGAAPTGGAGSPPADTPPVTPPAPPADTPPADTPPVTPPAPPADTPPADTPPATATGTPFLPRGSDADIQSWRATGNSPNRIEMSRAFFDADQQLGKALQPYHAGNSANLTSISDTALMQVNQALHVIGDAARRQAEAAGLSGNDVIDAVVDAQDRALAGHAVASNTTLGPLTSAVLTQETTRRGLDTSTLTLPADSAFTDIVRVGGANGANTGTGTRAGNGPGSATPPAAGGAGAATGPNPPSGGTNPPGAAPTGTGGAGGAAAGSPAPNAGAAGSPPPAGGSGADSGSSGGVAPGAPAQPGTGAGSTGSPAGTGAANGGGATGAGSPPQSGSGRTLEQRRRDYLEGLRQTTPQGAEGANLFAQVYKQLKKIKAPSTPTTPADAGAAMTAVLYLRMAASLAQIANISIHNVLHLDPAEIERRKQPSHTHGALAWVGIPDIVPASWFGRGIAQQLSFQNTTTGSYRSGEENISTPIHELWHIFSTAVCLNRGLMLVEIANGNQRAIEFDKAWRALADTLFDAHIADPYNTRTWFGAGEENMADFLSKYVTETAFNTRGTDPTYNKISKLPGFATFKQAFDEFLAKATKYLKTLHQLFNGRTPALAELREAIKNANLSKQEKPSKVKHAVYYHTALASRFQEEPQLRAFIDQFVNVSTLLPETQQGIMDANLNWTAQDFAELDYYQFVQITTLMSQAGLSYADAQRQVNEATMRGLELSNMTPLQAAESRNAKTTADAQEQLGTLPAQANEGVADSADSPDAGANSLVTAMHDDEATVRACMLNMPGADVASELAAPDPYVTPDDLAVYAPQSVDVAPAPAQSTVLSQEYRRQLANELDEGYADNVTAPVDASAQPWFPEWAARNGIRDADGNMRQLYRVGNTLISDRAQAGDNAVLTYGRAGNVADNADSISVLVANPELAQQIKDIYTRVEQEFAAGRNPQLTRDDAMTLAASGLDTLHITVNGKEAWLAAYPSAAAADLYQIAQDAATLDNADLAPPEDFPEDNGTIRADIVRDTTPGAVEIEEAAQMLLNNAAANSVARAEARNAYNQQMERLRRVTYYTPQRAGWWQRIATTVRLVADKAAHLHTWFVMNAAPTQGDLDSAPAYSALNDLPGVVRGAQTEMTNEQLVPLQTWATQVCAERGIDDVAGFLRDIGSALTALHTIEVAPIQERRLQEALADAMATGDQTAIDGALERIDLYQRRQAGEQGVSFALYGGRSVRECETLLTDLENRYGAATLEEGVKRMSDAWRSNVLYNIRNNVYQDEDIGRFGDYVYYCSFMTRPQGESTSTDDTVPLSPRMNYARDGSLEPALDAYSNLVTTIRRSANAIGAMSIGTTWQNMYDNLPPGETHTMFRGLVRFEYRQGLAFAPARNIQTALWRFPASYTQGLQNLVSSAVMVRIPRDMRDADGNVMPVLDASGQPVLDASGNPVPRREVATYYVWFNPRTHEREQAALRSYFDRPMDTKLGRIMRRATSTYASLFTTWRPMFPIVNAMRDSFERMFEMAGTSFRTADNQEVNGLKVSGRMMAILGNPATAARVARMVLMPSSALPDTEEGRALREFRRLGVMDSASMNEMLRRAAEDMSAYLDGASTDTSWANRWGEKVAPVTNGAKQVVDTARRWSEVWYTLPTFAHFFALVKSGVSPEDAAADTRKRMNMRMYGVGGRKLSCLYPFVSSIGQTAIQMTALVGLSTGAFGHAANKKIWSRAMRAYGVIGAVSVTTAFLLPLIARGLGDGDDEEGYRFLDSMDLPSITFLPIPTDGGFFKLQVGFGAPLFALQSAILFDRVQRGVITPGEAFADLFAVTTHNMSPFGGPTYETHTLEDWFAKLTYTFAPALAQPLVGTAMNKSFWGRPIDMLRRYARGNTRASDRLNPNVPIVWHDMARAIYDASGGFIDMSDATMRHLASSYMPGPLTAIFNAIEQDTRMTDPEHQTTRDVLGPVGMAVGTSMLYNAKGNTLSNLYWQATDYHVELQRRVGLGDVWSSSGSKMQAGDYRYQAYLDVGLSQEDAEDVRALQNMESDLREIDQAYKQTMRSLTNRGQDYDAASARLATEEWYRNRNYYLETHVPLLNFAQRGYKRTLNLPDQETINLGLNLIDARRNR